jgi:MFS family permease
MLAAAGAANIVSNITRGTINQLITPDELRGRVTGVNSMFTSTGPQLGQFSAGTMAALMGSQTGPRVGGVIIVALAASVAAVARSVRVFDIRVHAEHSAIARSAR